MKVEKELRQYILPNVLAMFGTSCNILADTYFISVAEGANGITALNLVLPIYGLLYAIGAMIGVGSATRHSLEKAITQVKNQDNYRNYFSNAILCTLLISLVFIMIGIFSTDQLLALMGADQQILAVGSNYARIVLMFAPCFMLNFTFTSFVRNDGAPKIAMAATLTSGTFNIIFDYILIFPCGMGMTGAALATGTAQIVSMSVCMIHYLSKKNTIHFQRMIPSMKMLLQACRLGVVAFVGELASGITTLAFNYILLGLAGNTAVAAYGVIANIALVGTSLLNGVSQGLQPMASKAHGKGDENTNQRILKHSLLIGGIISVMLVVMVWLSAEFLVAVFNQEHSLLLRQYAVYGIRIYFVGFIAGSINIIRAGYLSANGYGTESSIISISRGIVAIVVFAFVLSRFFGMTGVWLAFPAAEIFTLILAYSIIKK